jgi:hypothetical protein
MPTLKNVVHNQKIYIDSGSEPRASIATNFISKSIQKDIENNRIKRPATLHGHLPETHEPTGNYKRKQRTPNPDPSVNFGHQLSTN